MQSEIRYSDCTRHRQQSLIDYAIAHNLTPFISMQNHYHLLYREEEREMLPTLKVPFFLVLKKFVAT